MSVAAHPPTGPQSHVADRWQKPRCASVSDGSSPVGDCAPPAGKRDTSKESNKGTFLKSFDNDFALESIIKMRLVAVILLICT
ncbi:MAG TPA: hypothetical protein VM656_03640, partial [Pyrinomonadaceae bacterium]|nr:hypothetical protein [Pyrinomonadaceae bacterium]